MRTTNGKKVSHLRRAIIESEIAEVLDILDKTDESGVFSIISFKNRLERLREEINEYKSNDDGID